MYRFLHIVFQVLDDDNGGFLDRVEIREAFDTVLQMVLTDVEFETAVTGMDRDGDGSVSFKEFRKFFKHPKKRKDEIMARRRRTTKVVPVENDELQTADSMEKKYTAATEWVEESVVPVKSDGPDSTIML